MRSSFDQDDQSLSTMRATKESHERDGLCEAALKNGDNSMTLSNGKFDNIKDLISFEETKGYTQTGARVWERDYVDHKGVKHRERIFVMEIDGGWSKLALTHQGFSLCLLGEDANKVELIVHGEVNENMDYLLEKARQFTVGVNSLISHPF
jgi:hypothetical protein